MYTAFRNFKEIYNELVLDVEIAKKLDTDYCSEDFIKRTYTRALFAMIEGIVFHLKKIAIAINKNVNILQPTEILLLEEITVSLSDTGNVKKKPAKFGFIQNIIFSINSLLKVLESDNKIEKTNYGYEAMIKAIKIRDRITHPKSKEGININEEDLKILGDANAWFRDEIIKLIKLMDNNNKIAETHK